MTHRVCTSGPRLWENSAVPPFSEVPDLSRGEARFAAEVALQRLDGDLVPSFALLRAWETLTIMAAR